MKIGDEVTILWENLPTLFRVKVKYMPSCPDDVWTVEDKEGVEYSIKNYCLMRKEKSANGI